MYIIGVSGGIASGKSTVINILKSYGAYIIDCDELAKAVVTPNSSGLRAVISAFGPQSVLSDGTMNRAYIGNIVFNDVEQKKKLESILHPLIHEKIDIEIKRLQKNKKAKIVFLDMPLLFELKYYLYVDETWLVYVDPATQLQRLMNRNNYTADEASARIHAQLPIDEKKSLAQVIIDNTGSLEYTEEQVRIQWNLLLSKGNLGGGNVEAETE
ncbi:dephospho-CoA kinase [Megasphaera paucivorans]|uniref:Dephospho-CoA kinase n=1 Tax=Megasphaera paucivorans TaxID=349095 RepID=A0A1G9Q6B9_9FIRM|nr:dephospho-CoA kinase [Megasphaera paucivorans]SDM05895.1 dephospho-CoA kinase [Megasphaera paucivorans]